MTSRSGHAPEGARFCATCGTARLTGGREQVCQSCAALALLATEPGSASTYVPAPGLSGTASCASCGTAPVGPGGILCPGCKTAIAARGAR